MKRILIAAILGIAAASSSLGAGSVWFENYAVNNYSGAPIFYTPGVPVPGSYGFNGELAYAFGIVGEAAGNGDLLPAFALQGKLALIGGWGMPGFFDGGIVSVPDYVSGPITFEVLAFSGPSYSTSLIRGHSAAFTLMSIATGVELPGTLDGLQSFTLIPEPTAAALAGVGAALLLMRRRRSGAR
jgi:hypothetical protein